VNKVSDRETADRCITEWLADLDPGYGEAIGYQQNASARRPKIVKVILSQALKRTRHADFITYWLILELQYNMI